MSVFQVSELHINTLTTALDKYKIIDSQSRNAVTKLLIKENLLSLRARYNDFSSEAELGRMVSFYNYKKTNYNMSLIALYKACQCYEYQSCEHSEFPKSKAYKYIQSLKEYIRYNLDMYNDEINSLEEYDKAEWEVTKDSSIVSKVTTQIKKVFDKAEWVKISDVAVGKANFYRFFQSNNMTPFEAWVEENQFGKLRSVTIVNGVAHINLIPIRNILNA